MSCSFSLFLAVVITALQAVRDRSKLVGRKRTDWESIMEMVHLKLEHPGIEASLGPLLWGVPKGRRKVAIALIRNPAATYPQLADGLGVSLGTLHTHLRRIRQRHQQLYVALMELREHSLAQRHVAALRRAGEHSRKWFRKMRRSGYTYYGRGVWMR